MGMRFRFRRLVKLRMVNPHYFFGFGVDAEHHVVFRFHAPRSGGRLPLREVEHVRLFVIEVVEFQNMDDYC